MKKVGIFSGTFDPVHEGHIGFAKEALKQCGLDKVFFLVEPRPRRKQGVKAFKHRVNMVSLAIEDEPDFGLIILEQPRFTVTETMPILAKRFAGAQLNFLMGEDVLASLADWPAADSLLERIHFIIGQRQNESKIKHHLDLIQKTKGRPLSHSVFRAEFSDVNSSNIRAALRRREMPEGLNPEVAAYIELNGLYMPAKE